jgi:NADH:ubiquinone oxidoreductase subunit 4 (subunit M)
LVSIFVSFIFDDEADEADEKSNLLILSVNYFKEYKVCFLTSQKMSIGVLDSQGFFFFFSFFWFLIPKPNQTKYQNKLEEYKDKKI